MLAPIALIVEGSLRSPRSSKAPVCSTLGSLKPNTTTTASKKPILFSHWNGFSSTPSRGVTIISTLFEEIILDWHDVFVACRERISSAAALRESEGSEDTNEY